jgi:hypothetical protein
MNVVGPLKEDEPVQVRRKPRGIRRFVAFHDAIVLFAHGLSLVGRGRRERLRLLMDA